METSLFHCNAIELNITAKTKEEVIDAMIDVLDKDGVLNDRDAYREAIYVREEMSTTGIGFGIAIPHAKSPAVNQARVAFGLSKDGVAYGSEDGGKVHLIFMIAVSSADDNLHVQTLAKLSRKLINPVFRNALLQCTEKEQVIELFAQI